MKFSSTRGVRGLTFEEALCSGYAADGGLMLPETIPQISMETLKSWSQLTYIELAKKIVPLFVEDEIPLSDLDDIFDAAFRKFSHPDILPIKRLRDNLNVMEMFHGVTWAFKDLSLCCIGLFFNYFLSKKKKHVIILTATSGDTGSAAIESVRGLTWVDIVVMLPRGWTSRIQELQMTTVLADNVHVYRVDGNSDDIDDIVKACFEDADFVEKHGLCSLNSVNVARIIMQTVHFFYAYLQMCPSCDGEVEMAIPTGGCGNVTSGCIAVKMGLPVKLVCCVTHNDIVARSIQKGDYSATKVIPSLAPSMDLQCTTNMERIWHLFSGGDATLVDSMMWEFEHKQTTKVPNELREKIATVVSTHVVDDEGIKRTMKRCWEENSYLVCPHTATAVDYHYSKQGTPGHGDLRLCLASASPMKFEEAVTAAGLTYTKSDAVLRLLELPTRSEDWNRGEDWVAALRKKTEEIAEKFSKKINSIY